jgi:hypothetical protein
MQIPQLLSGSCILILMAIAATLHAQGKLDPGPQRVPLKPRRESDR